MEITLTHYHWALQEVCFEMCCIPWSFHLMSIRELAGSWSRYPQDSVWPFPVRAEHTLGRIFGTLVHRSEHSITHPELPYTYFLIIITGYSLLIGGYPIRC